MPDQSTDDNGNGKVTLAVLNNNILHLTKQVEPLSDLCTKVAVMDQQLNGKDGLVERAVAHETRMDEMDRKSNWLAGVNAMLTTIGSTLAAVFGATR